MIWTKWWMFVFIYLPIFIKLVSDAVDQYINFQIKADNRYETIEFASHITWFDKIRHALSSNFIILILCFIPGINIIFMLNLIFKMEELEKTEVTRRLETGRLRERTTDEKQADKQRGSIGR